MEETKLNREIESGMEENSNNNNNNKRHWNEKKNDNKEWMHLKDINALTATDKWTVANVER